MAREVIVNFKALGVQEVARAFASIIEAAEKAEKAMGGGVGGGRGGGRGRLGAQEKESREYARNLVRGYEKADKLAKKAADDELKRREAIVIKSSTMAGKLAAKQVKEEAQARDRERRRQEAEEKRNFRERIAAEKRAIRERVREEAQAHRSLTGFFRGSGTAVVRGANALGGAFANGTKRLVHGAMELGGGFDVVSTLKGGLDAAKQAALYVNSSADPEVIRLIGGTTGVLNRAKATSLSTGLDKGSIIEAAREYVKKSSDALGGVQNMDFFAKVAIGNGTEIKDVAGMAGILKSQNKGLEGPAMRDMVEAVVKQGQLGAVEIDVLARMAGKITKTAPLYGVNQTEAQKQLLGMAQIAYRTSGNEHEAATAVSNFGAETIKKRAKLEAAGINPMNNDGTLAGFDTIIGSIFDKTKGDLGKVMGLGYNERSFKFLEAFAPGYRDARDTALANKGSAADAHAAGVKAVVDEIRKFTGAKGDAGETDSRFNRVQETTAAKLENAVNRIKEILIDNMSPYLERFASSLPGFIPVLENGMKTLAPIVQTLGAILGQVSKTLADSGIAGAGLLFASQMKGAVGMLANTLIAGMATIDAIFEKERKRQAAEFAATVDRRTLTNNIEGFLGGLGRSGPGKMTVDQGEALVNSAKGRMGEMVDRVASEIWFDDKHIPHEGVNSDVKAELGRALASGKNLVDVLGSSPNFKGNAARMEALKEAERYRQATVGGSLAMGYMQNPENIERHRLLGISTASNMNAASGGATGAMLGLALGAMGGGVAGAALGGVAGSEGLGTQGPFSADVTGKLTLEAAAREAASQGLTNFGTTLEQTAGRVQQAATTVEQALRGISDAATQMRLAVPPPVSGP